MKINEIISPTLLEAAKPVKTGTHAKPHAPKNRKPLEHGDEMYVGDDTYQYDERDNSWENMRTKMKAQGLLLQQIQQQAAGIRQPKQQSIGAKLGNWFAGEHGRATRNDPTKTTAQKVGGVIGSYLGSKYGAYKDRAAQRTQAATPIVAKAAALKKEKNDEKIAGL